MMTSGESQSTLPWNDVCRPWREELDAFYRERDVGEQARETTINTNTTLVPQRGDALLRMLRELAELPSIEGLRVLEAGCGFGALAAYLAWRGSPATVVAADVDLKYLRIARAAAGASPIPDERLRYVEADMRDLGAFEDESFDLVVVNNALIYLTSRADARRALAEFHRILAPGGTLLLYHANKWRWREPFTRAPVVHLLPGPLARIVSPVTGWKHNHGRVRLISPPALRRALRRTGFENLATEGYGKERHRSGLKRNLGTFYAHAARRPST